MALGLGVDAGGTFTDAAIVGPDSQKVLAKAKAPHDTSRSLRRDHRGGGGGRSVHQPLEARLGSPVAIPGDHDVGNAVGAVLSQVTETAAVRIFSKDFEHTVLGPGVLPMEHPQL